MGDVIAGVPRFEHAVRTAIALSRVALQNGDLVGLFSYAATPQSLVAPGAGFGQLARLLSATAPLTQTAVETNHVLSLHHLARQLKRRSLVVVFSEFADVTSAELLVEVLGALARKHLVMFVALDNPELHLPVAAVPEGRQQMSEAIVASAMIDRREQVLTRLRRSGVNVVQVEAGQMVGGVLRRYLHIKERGLIG